MPSGGFPITAVMGSQAGRDSTSRPRSREIVTAEVILSIQPDGRDTQAALTEYQRTRGPWMACSGSGQIRAGHWRERAGNQCRHLTQLSHEQHPRGAGAMSDHCADARTVAVKVLPGLFGRRLRLGAELELRNEIGGTG